MNKELSDDTVPFFQPIVMCNNYFDELFLTMPPLPDLIPDVALNFLLQTCSNDDLLWLGNKISLHYIPFATRATTLDNVKIMIVQNFPPRRLMTGVVEQNVSNLRIPSADRGLGVARIARRANSSQPQICKQ